MADTCVYLRCDECSKRLRTFNALLKQQHFEQHHVNKQHQKRAVFLQNDEEVQLTVPQAIRSPAVQAEYKAWLAGVTERINGVHHQRHKRKFTLATDKSSTIYPFSVQTITKVNNKHARKCFKKWVVERRQHASVGDNFNARSREDKDDWSSVVNGYKNDLRVCSDGKVHSPFNFFSLINYEKKCYRQDIA